MNRPAPISVFSDQYRTKSTTRSRTSCGTHTLVRAPQDFFLKRCARPSIRPAPRPWFGSSFPETRSVVVPLDGPAGSCPGRQLRHSRRTLSANGRTPWAAVHAPHRDQKPALYPTSAASGWQPSPLKCSAFALFACRPLRYLNGRTLSPLPAEARQSHVQFAYAGLAGAMLDDQDAWAADFVPITNNRGHERGAVGTFQDDEVGGGDGFHSKSVVACWECRALPAHLSRKCETAVECILGDSRDRVCANGRQRDS